MTYILHLVWSRVASTWGAVAEPVCNLLVAVIAGSALLNPSKKIIAHICMMAGLVLSNAAIAEDSRLGEFQSKIEKMAEVMNKFRQGPTPYYTINAINKGALAETKVWNYTTSGFGLSACCEISVNQNSMDRLNISDDALAWVIGHELGHCELGHRRTIPALTIPADSWKDEYDADLVGKRLMQAAGYNFEMALAEITLMLGNKKSNTHPDAKNRVANMTTPNITRYYPSLVGLASTASGP